MSNVVSDIVLVFSFFCFIIAGILSGSVGGFLLIVVSGGLFGLFMLAMFD